MNFVVLTSASSANSGIFSSSRMMYGLAQSHQAPRLLVSYLPTACRGMLSSLSACSSPHLPADPSLSGKRVEGFEIIAAVATTLILFIWALILVLHSFRKKHRAEHNVSPFSYILPQ